MAVTLRLKKMTDDQTCVICKKTIKKGEWGRYRNARLTSHRFTHIDCIPDSQTKIQCWKEGTSVYFVCEEVGGS